MMHISTYLRLLCAVAVFMGTAKHELDLSPMTAQTSAMPTWVETQTADPVLIPKIALASDSNPSGMGDQVANGDALTLTISADRSGPNTVVSNISLRITINPDVALLQLNCQNNSKDPCVVTTASIPIGSLNGDPLQAVKQIGWTTKYSDLSGGTSSTSPQSFTAQLLGQPDGNLITVTAILRYTVDGGVDKESVQQKVITARNNFIGTGQSQIAPWPSWRSAEIAGVYSQDWGDYDRDGDLDLALGYWSGAKVYRNDEGVLVPVNIPAPEPAQGGVYAVRWANVLPDPMKLELLVAGIVKGATAETGFLNVIQFPTPEQAERISPALTSPVPIARLVVANFAGDPQKLDVVASNAKYDPQCPMIIFTDTLQGSCSGLPFQPTAALDIVNLDHKPYLVTSDFSNYIRLFEFKNNVFTPTYIITDEFSFPPYDFAWADYDGDGKQDLAAAFPLQQEVRIYHGDLEGESSSNFTWTPVFTIPTNNFFAPLSMDWANLDSDKDLELIIATQPPTAYDLVSGKSQKQFVELKTSLGSLQEGQIWSLRAVQMGPSLDTKFLIANGYQPSWLYDVIQPHLSSSPEQPIQGNFHSITLGDVDGDGVLDRVFGAENLDNRTITIVTEKGNAYIEGAGNGPQDVSLGDVNGNFTQDVAVGATRARIYRGAAGQSFLLDHAIDPQGKVALALGDADGDLRLDVALGSVNGGRVQVFTNTQSFTTAFNVGAPAWQSPLNLGARALAWADVDGDNYLDLLTVDGDGHTARLFHNTGNQMNLNAMFTQVWAKAVAGETIECVAFGNANGDGYPDLALGTQNSVYVFESNHTADLLTDTAAITLPIQSSIDLAWGDWNNDNLPELAVVDSLGAHVYANLNSKPGRVQLNRAWSIDATNITGLAWGDMDGNGWLDLAESRKNGSSGVYTNTATLSARTQMPTVQLHRLGNTADAYGFSSSEILGDYLHPTATVVFTPTGTMAAPLTAQYAFSNDDGNSWYTTIVSPPNSSIDELGKPYPSSWDLQTSAAVGNAARFRVKLIANGDTGQPNAPMTSAVSPPFQALGIGCDWPSYIWIDGPDTLYAGNYGTFKAFPMHYVGGGGQTLTHTWQFGNGEVGQAQEYPVRYNAPGTYIITHQAASVACPRSRVASAYKVVNVIAKPQSQSSTSSQEPATPALFDLGWQVQGLLGTLEEGKVRLTWQTLSGITNLQRYQIYRGSMTQTATIWADVPITQTQFKEIAQCGQFYFVTGLTDQSESLPSATSFYTPACPTGNVTAAPADDPISVSPRPETAISSGFATAPVALTSQVNLQPDPHSTPPVDVLAASCSQVAPDWLGYLPSISQGARRASAQSVDPIAPAFITLADEDSAPIHYPPAGTTMTGVIKDPVLSGNGMKVAFTSNGNPDASNTDFNLEIFMQTALSNSHVTLSAGNLFGGYNLGASINHDGSRLAFFSDRKYVCAGCETQSNLFSNYEIFVAYTTATGITYTQVTSTSFDANTAPYISRNGKYLVFVSNADMPSPLCSGCNNPNRSSQVYRATLGPAHDGTLKVTEMLSLTANASPNVIYDFPIITENGNVVAYLANTGTNGAFRVLKGSGSCPIGTSLRERPSMTEDGSSIYYASPSGLIMLNNGKLLAGINGRAPMVSADGKTLIYLNAEKRATLMDIFSAQSKTLSSANYVGIAADGERVMMATEKTIDVVNLVDLHMSVVSSTAVAGSLYTQTVIIANAGIFTAKDVSVVQNFDKTDIFTGALTCPSVQDIPAGITTTVTCTGTIHPGFKGSFTTFVTVTTTSLEVNTANNAQAIQTSVIQQAQLVLTSAFIEPPTVDAGDDFFYDVTVENQGPSDADGTELIFDVSGDATPNLSSGCTSPALSISRFTIVCPLGTLAGAPSQGYSKTVKLKLKAGTEGQISITMRAQANGESAKSEQLTRTVTIQPKAALKITQKIEGSLANAGSTIKFVIDVTNSGPSPAQNMIVTSHLSVQKDHPEQIEAVIDSFKLCEPSAKYIETLITNDENELSVAITILNPIPISNTPTSFSICAHIKKDTPAPTQLTNKVTVTSNTSGSLDIEPEEVAIPIDVTSIQSVSITCKIGEDPLTSCLNGKVNDTYIFHGNVMPDTATSPKYVWSIKSEVGDEVAHGVLQELPFTFSTRGKYVVTLSVTRSGENDGEPTSVAIQVE